MILNLPLAVYLMKLFQFTSFLVLINIELPSNVENFIEKFRFSLFNFLEYAPFNEDKLACVPKNRFKIEEYSCALINNNFILVSELVGIVVIKLIVSSIAKLTQEK